MATTASPSCWTDHLDTEDLAFVKRFILVSGSLKALAKTYDISYPTVRLRLDRLIQKVKVIDEQQSADAFERTARLLFADGRIDAESLLALLAAHRQTQEEET